MRRIRIPNPLLDKNYRTYLDADYSSGTALTVPNNNSFAANDFLVVGEPREEKTELRQVSSLTGNTTININSAFRFSHNKATVLYKTPWDFVSIERRTSSAGTFAEITSSAIQWDNKLNETVYFDSAATSAYQYRFRYYNSSSLTYSEYSDTQDGATPSHQSVRYMVDEVRKLTNDIERRIIPNDDEIIRAFNRGQDLIYIHNPKYSFLQVDIEQVGSGSITAVANQSVYSLANLTNFGHLSSIKFSYNSGGVNVFYHLKQISPVEFDRLDSNRSLTAQDWPGVYKLLPPDTNSANGYFKIVPKSLSTIGIFYPNYYKKMPNLDSPADTTLVPLPDVLIDYAVGYVERIKGNEAKATTYLQSLEEHVVSLRGRAVTIEAKGLKMLDTMDAAAESAANQPKNLVRFRGQKAISRLYGNRATPLQPPDYWKENYF